MQTGSPNFKKSIYLDEGVSLDVLPASAAGGALVERPVGGLLPVQAGHDHSAAAPVHPLVRAELGVVAGAPALGIDLKVFKQIAAGFSFSSERTDLVLGAVEDPEGDLGEAGHGHGDAEHENEQDQGENQSDVTPEEDACNRHRND